MASENLTIIDYEFSLDEYAKLTKFIRENFKTARIYYLMDEHD